MPDTIQFFARSADKPVGLGVGDIIIDPIKYNELDNILHWRKIFSSLWDIASFRFGDLTYRSFDHALQSEKFRCNGYEEIANNFSLESGHEIGQGSGIMAFKARKIKILTDSEIERWHLITKETKRQIYLSKFEQIPIAKKALLGTYDAEIWNDGPRIKRIRCFLLEETRDILKNQQK
jgi:hypothetical protein